MPQTVNLARLKTSAEHLEWVFDQYPGSDDVQQMRKGLRRLIDDAKEGRILIPAAEGDAIPFRWAVFVGGLFRDYRNPDVGGAYADFVNELAGGLTEEEKRIIADISS